MCLLYIKCSSGIKMQIKFLILILKKSLLKRTKFHKYLQHIKHKFLVLMNDILIRIKI